MKMEDGSVGRKRERRVRVEMERKKRKGQTCSLRFFGEHNILIMNKQNNIGKLICTGGEVA